MTRLIPVASSRPRRRLPACTNACTDVRTQHPSYAHTLPTHTRTHERQRRMDGRITAQSMTSLCSSTTSPSITTMHALCPRRTPWQNMGHITLLHPSRLRRPHIVCSHSCRRPAQPLHRLPHGRLHVRLPSSLSPHPCLTESCSDCRDLTPWPSSICRYRHLRLCLHLRVPSSTSGPTSCILVAHPSLCFVCPQLCDPLCLG